MITTHAVPIQKEAISSLKFPVDPVRLKPDHQRERDRAIERAMTLGNTERHKCRILFKDSEGLKVVETTIWSCDKQNIVLKYGLTIPVSRVVSIEMH